jgi:hypothetical protein
MKRAGEEGEAEEAVLELHRDELIRLTLKRRLEVDRSE